jgi:hypothetical protein
LGGSDRQVELISIVLVLMSSVGELGKTLSPSKCLVTDIHETGSRNNYRKKVYIYEKGWNEES